MNDILISYAHIDDEPLSEGSKGWISQFHRNLEVRLSQLIGERPSIWRDPKLTGTDVFGDVIVDQLAQVKALILVMSPRYVRSEWCVRECATFYASAERKGGVRVGSKSRIVKVVKTPVAPAEIPPPLDVIFNSQLGYEFYEVDPETGRAREFYAEFGPEAKQRFFQKVDDVAHDLRDLLELVSKGPPSKAAEAAGTSRQVFLAMPSSDLQPAWDCLRRELLERGHRVVPNDPLPLALGPLSETVSKQLGQSDLAVHLIGEQHGWIPEGGDCSAVELQNRLAAEQSRRANLVRIIWIPRDLRPTDERQARFVLRLREDEAAQQGADIVQDTVERLKGLVLDRLRPPVALAAAAAISAPPPRGPPRLYVICDPRDDTAVDAIEDFFFEQGSEVGRLRFESADAELEAAHRQHLLRSDAVLVYYGAASSAWVDMKLLDLDQAAGYGRTTPFAFRVIGIAPPEDRAKLRYRTHAAEVIRLPEPFSGESLQPLVARLKAWNSQGGRIAS
jgi:hypothetical protein